MHGSRKTNYRILILCMMKGIKMVSVAGWYSRLLCQCSDYQRKVGKIQGLEGWGGVGGGNKPKTQT